VWAVEEDGVIGEVKQPRLQQLADVNKLKAPYEMLDKADLTKVNEGCAKTGRFVMAGTLVRPFERMQFLRGTENLYMDLAYGDKEVYLLRDILHEFFLKDMEMWCKTDIDAVSFMDDWGSQKNLLISPDMWREFYKPLYKDYADIAHKHGKYIFFHSDGNISSIYPDLIEVGINAVNSQLFCMNIEELAAKYKGKITFWGEIDRQNILPFGTVADVRAAVQRVRKVMDTPACNGGVIAECEFGPGMPTENIMTVFEEWEKV
jgi:uroporphyrinogen-III decarboxylase